MSLRERAEHTTKSVGEALQQEIAGDQHTQVAKIIEDAIIKAVLEERERCVIVAIKCCPEDQDKAHKISEAIRRAEGALVANLQSMR